MAREDVNLAIAVFLGATLATLPFGIDRLPTDTQGQAVGWKAAPEGAESITGYTTAFFEDWVVPFEALSVLLLVALIGAVALAARVRSQEEEQEGGP